MKIPQISGLKLIKILNKAGFEIIRRKGSHVRLEKRINEKIIKLTVPMHDKLKKGTPIKNNKRFQIKRTRIRKIIMIQEDLKINFST